MESGINTTYEVKTVALIGATGLIGGHLLQQLVNDGFFDEIRVVVRRPFESSSRKVTVHVIDFEDQEQFRTALAGCDIVFCAVGTTQKKVNNDKAAYRKVDYDIPVHAAIYARAQACETFVIVSAVGADSKKQNFYLKLKGEVEDRLREVGFPSLHIFRPSLLMGKHKERRFGEDFAQIFMRLFAFLLPQKLKGIKPEIVSKAMVNAAKSGDRGTIFYHYREMMDLANKMPK